MPVTQQDKASLSGLREGQERRQRQVTFQIDPEFSTIGRGLTPEEEILLKSSLKKDGCIDPIVTWNGIVVDGHNRYRLCTENGIPFKTHEIMLVDRQAAREWIIDHQLGKRNLTDEEKAYYRGLRYNEEKKPHGGDRASGHNVHLSTAKQLAEKFGVDEKTIRRDAEFSEAVDTLDESEPGMKGKILSGKSGLTKKEVVSASKVLKESPGGGAVIKKKRKEKRRRRPPLIELNPPKNAMQFARMAVMDLREIRKDDVDRQEAFSYVKGWIESHEVQT